MIISKLDKYIIKKFLGTYIFLIIGIITIAVVFDLNEKSDKFIQKEAPLNAIIFDYYLSFIPFYANLFSSLFVFLAVILFTSKLANNSEIIAMLSSGISFKRLLKPYMMSAAVITIVSFFLNSYVIPPSNIKRIDFQNQYVRNKRVDYASNIQIQVAPGTIAYIGRFNNIDKRGYQFSLDTFEGKELKSRTIANEVRYDSIGHWTASDYTVRDFKKTREVLTSGDKKTLEMDVSPEDFLISANDFEQMTTPKLSSYIDKQKERGMASSIKSFEIEYHKRFANVASAFILTIIGASLSSRKIKGGMGLNLGLGILLSVSYILFMTVSSSFAVSGTMSPLIASWLPNIVFAFIAAYLYRKAPN